MLFNHTIVEKTRKKVKNLKTKNRAGGDAFKVSDVVELTLRAATITMGSDAFYESDGRSTRRFVELIGSVGSSNPGYIPKLAAYNRNILGNRSSSTVLLGEGAQYIGGIEGVRKYVSSSINRVDDITELLAYMIKKNVKSGVPRTRLPMAIKKGLVSAFGKFDEYQFGKYNKPGKMVSVQDAMFILHPKATSDEKRELYQRIADGALSIPETWENYIMINGSTKKNWTYILDKMGYYGIIRNIRNLLKHNVNVDDIVDEINDPARIRTSKLNPVNFYMAYRAIEGTKYSGVSKVSDALSEAMDISLDNIPIIDGTTYAFCDNSGSMKHTIHAKSKVKYNDIGNVFGAMLYARARNVHTFAFGTNVASSKISRKLGILENANLIASAGRTVGESTHTSKCIQRIALSKEIPDRIMFFTDEQGYGQPSCYDALLSYRVNTGTNPYVYTFDLAHSGTTQFPSTEDRHCTVGGWSDKLLGFIPMFESDRTTMVEYIDSIYVEDGRVVYPKQ